MKKSVSRPKYRQYLRVAILLAVVVAAALLASNLLNKPADNTVSAPIKEITKTVEKLQINTLETKTLEVLAKATGLPAFATQDGLTISLAPGKNDAGTYNFVVKTEDQEITYEVTATHKAIDAESLKAEINKILGNKQSSFGVLVRDLNNKANEVQINPLVQFYPGSIAKMPVVVLTLLDIDAGKISFDDTYAVQAQYKFSTSDSIGRLANGTKVKVRELIEKTIHESNNTAMYHLRGLLGGIDEVERREKSDLNLYNFNDAPHHIVAPLEVGQLYEQLYRGTLLSKANSEYLIDLMKNTLPSMREGIPKGINDSSLQIANKVGFLNSLGKVSYGDSAIVFGKKTDYILVIVDKNIAWNEALDKIHKISKLVQSRMDI